MTPFDPISCPGKSGDFETLVHDLSSYLQFHKKMGVDRLLLSARSLEVLAAWGHSPAHRNQLVHSGPASADVVLVDGTGNFFNGEAGALLKKILGAMKLSADRVCLCNAPDVDQVLHFLKSVHPRVVIALGDRAVGTVTGKRESVAALRGHFVNIQGFSVMPTFHPVQLLKDPALKRPVWEDMQQVMQVSGILS